MPNRAGMTLVLVLAAAGGCATVEMDAAVAPARPEAISAPAAPTGW